MFRSYTEKVFRPNFKLQPSPSTKLQWYSCDICDTDDDLEAHWRSETDVELHRKEMHNDLIFQQMKDHADRFCTVCMTLQDSAAALLNHLKQRHLFSSPSARRIEREIYICDYCQHVFFNKEVLETHIQYLHLWTREQRKKKSFVCPKCEKSCKLKSLWFHMQNHDIPSLSVCDICLFVACNMRELMVHVREHPLYYTCQICNYRTSKEIIFESHMKKHKAVASKRDMFKIKRFLKMAFLKRVPLSLQAKYNIHHPMKGLVIPSFLHICILCREICMDKTEMLEHVAREHMFTPEATPKPSFLCICGAQFPSRVLLRHHAFKMKGTHREVTEEPTTSRNEPTSKMIQTITVPIEVDVEAIQNKTKETRQTEPTWLISPDIEIELIDAKSDAEGEVMLKKEMPIQTPEEEKSDDSVYIYATVNDEDLVTIEQDGGRIIGF